MEIVLIRLPELVSRIGLKRSSIYAMIARGEFPEPIRLGRRSSAWVGGEVDDWIKSRIQASRGSSMEAK